MTETSKKSIIGDASNFIRTSAQYTYLQDALNAQWLKFLELEKQILKFVPVPKPQRLSQLGPEIASFTEQFRDQPEILQAQLSMYDERASDGGQTRELFAPRLIAEHSVVVVLTHALCEGYINASLAIGLACQNAFDLFEIIEKSNFIEKWRSGPKSFLSSYVFPRGSAIDETLGQLHSCRNRIVHYKTPLEINDRRITYATPLKLTTFDAELLWIRRFFSLPYDLEEFVIRRIPGESGRFMPSLMSNLVERVPVHRL